MWEAVDSYCERTAPLFWAEPWNAASNGAFLIAALLAYLYVFRTSKSFALYGLPLLMAMIAVGSFLFHTFAHKIAMIADVTPILLFQLWFLALFLRRVVQLSHLEVGCGLALFLISGPIIRAALDLLPEVQLYGSEDYFPALIAMAFIASYTRQVIVPSRAFDAAAGLFIVSLAFRTVDLPLCALWPLGTHFLWHICNAIVLYLMVRGLADILNVKRSDAA